MKLILKIALVTAMFSGSAWAQDSGEWDWKITPYFWWANIDGLISIGPIDSDVDVSLSDILSNLDIGGSVFGEVGKDKHSVHIDYTYLRISPDPTELESPPGAEVSTKLTNKIFEAAYNYRWRGPNGPALVLGARMTDMAMRMSFTQLPAVEAGPSWWDYFVGIKSYNMISNKWDFQFYGTVGAGGSDLPWTAQAVFGRHYSNDNRLMLGARVWGVDYSKGEGSSYAAMDLTYYGFMLGYEFN